MSGLGYARSSVAGSQPEVYVVLHYLEAQYLQPNVSASHIRLPDASVNETLMVLVYVQILT